MSKLPLDNRVRPVFIIRNNKREVVISDGKGNAYYCNNDMYSDSSHFISKENLINKRDYEFDRGLSGFDF